MSAYSALSANPQTIPYVQELVAKRSAKVNTNGCGNTILEVANVRMQIETYQDGYVAQDIFLDELYAFQSNSRVVVLDIGMNIGLASLYFAQMEHVEHIYGYELFEDTYRQALHNLLLNPMLAMKITASNQGVWRTSEKKTLEYNYEWKASLGLFGRPNYLDGTAVFETRTVELLDATTVLKSVRSEYPSIPLVAKLDCEGSEYSILEAWAKSNTLSEFAGLIIEWHENNMHTKDELGTILQRNRFLCKYVDGNNTDFGMLYATNSTYEGKISFHACTPRANSEQIIEKNG